MQVFSGVFFLMAWQVAFCLVLLVSSVRVEAAETTSSSPYTVAVIPFYSPEKIWLLYTPFIEYLKAATSLPWELKLYPDHNSLIEDLCNDKIGISLLGPVPMGRVDQQCGVKPFLVAKGKDGTPSYRSVIVTSDPAIHAFSDLRGRKFGFFKGSTAAHIVPLKMLKDAGIAESALQPVFLESQDRIMTALLSKELSAAGVKESLYRKFKDDPLRVLKLSAPLPNFAFCAAPALPRETLERFTAVLLKIQPQTNPPDARMVKTWDDEIKNGFMLPDSEFFEQVMSLHAVYLEMMHED